MQELISTFHIDWRLLIAQLVNFGIVVFVLWRFALRPVMKILNERSQTIEKSLAQAAKIEAELKEVQSRSAKSLAEAKQTASVIMKQAKEQAVVWQNQKVKETETKLEALARAHEEQLQRQQVELLEQAKSELAAVVAQAAGKVIKTKLTARQDEKLIKESLKNL